MKKTEILNYLGIVHPSFKSLKKNKNLINLKKDRLKTFNISNRRYLGNKYKLLPFIKYVVDKECHNINSIADIFSGTGAVSSAFLDKRIITNDILYSNYICNQAFFGCGEYDSQKIQDIIIKYNSSEVFQQNYMSNNFENTFFNKKNCMKIGYIRENIEEIFCKNEINLKEYYLLITSLLYGMDKIANTCGHYDAYRKNTQDNGKVLELAMPILSQSLNNQNMCFNIDANQIVKQIDVDLVYIDPPYNSRQYSDLYHLLENVAKWEKPQVYGIAKKMDRKNIKSDYCTINASKFFEDLIKNIKSKYILLSYNNMSNKGNSRSNAKISDREIYRILSQKGEVKIFSTKYKSFTTGKSSIDENEERLFLCKCFQENTEKTLISSPLNYIGGKFKLLPQILKYFPKKIDTFVDLFAGGCNVGININAKQVLFYDNNKVLMGMYNTFQNMNKRHILNTIFKIIKKYDLSLSYKQGYSYYGVGSDKGLSSYNKERFIKLREDFNNYKKRDNYYYIMFYVITIYSFNHQIRFNKLGIFNTPVGKRDFNSKIQKKLSNFLDKLQSGNYSFISKDFRKFDIKSLSKNSFIYIDPPYLITCASYNEQEKWNQRDEKELLKLIDLLDSKGIKFALSNVLFEKGKKNDLLSDWINLNKDRYKIIEIENSYSNSNYQIRNKISNSTREVLVIN